METQTKSLIVLIDTTGSMKSWIMALETVLKSLVRALALTSAFDKLAIMSYKDYDQKIDQICEFSGFADCTNIVDIQKLQTFASNLKATGGGDTPEAWKTALLEIAKLDHIGRLYILHLADAPPHEEIDLQREGKIEKQTLGDMFDYIKIYNQFAKQIPDFRYSCLTTYPHNFYCHLAQASEGGLHKLTGGTTSENIRDQINRVLNSWFGFDNPISDTYFIEMNQFENEISLCSEAMKNMNVSETKDKILSEHLAKVMNRMKTDSVFLEHIISEFEHIIRTDPISLTVSPILGKMWREFCKRRSDPRRDDLIELFSKRKHTVSATDAIILDEWLKESYNATSEINAEILKFMSKNKTVGLLRFVPENDFLHAQQIVHLLASNSKKSIANVRAILCRLQIDNNFVYDTIDENNEILPIPANSIPLNLPTYTFFETVMHTVAPGTKLTRRYAGMLAMHAIQCGSILAPFATDYLNKIKGKWINWKRHPDETPEVPECWNATFLSLILSCKDFLTEEELSNAEYYKKISYLLKFYHQLEVTVEVIDTTSIDGIFPCHMMNCTECKLERPRTLITDKGNCGYCYWGESPNPNIKFLQLRCFGCGIIYHRDASAYVSGNSKCYNCRNPTIAKAPTIQCTKCNLKYVNHCVTNSPTVCKICEGGERTLKLLTKEFPAYTDTIFDTECFTNLCLSVGFKVGDAFKKNTGLHQAVLHIIPIEESIIVDIPKDIKFREKDVCNIETIWKYLLEIMSGSTPVQPDCAVCMESFNPTQLMPACGRKGCSQRICVPCATNWYGKNIPGKLLYNRAIECSFCSRVPNPKILSKINYQLVSLAQYAKELNPDKHYAWCIDCLKPEEIGVRDCAKPNPGVNDFKCESCIIQKSGAEIKKCPGCSEGVTKISGCNHIKCRCGTHWCWTCTKKFDSSDETYNHMRTEHGGYFDEGDY